MSDFVRLVLALVIIVLFIIAFAIQPGSEYVIQAVINAVQ